MFEGDVGELDAAGVLTSAAECHAEAQRCEARLLLHAQAFADLHSADILPRRRNSASAGCDSDRGRERGVVLGGTGCPAITEFAPAEFGAVVLRVSAGSAAVFIGQALALRHRLPRRWAAVLAGEAAPWRARKIATACLELSEEAVALVDARVAGIIDSVTPGRLSNIVRAAVWQADPEAADPEAAEAAARQKARERGVYVGRSDDHGTKSIYVLAASGDVIRFDATIDAIAQALQSLGDPDPLRLRRARAIGILANPHHAVALLTAARSTTSTPPPPATPPTSSTEPIPPTLAAQPLEPTPALRPTPPTTPVPGIPPTAPTPASEPIPPTAPTLAIPATEPIRPTPVAPSAAPFQGATLTPPTTPVPGIPPTAPTPASEPIPPTAPTPAIPAIPATEPIRPTPVAPSAAPFQGATLTPPTLPTSGILPALPTSRAPGTPLMPPTLPAWPTSAKLLTPPTPPTPAIPVIEFDLGGLGAALDSCSAVGSSGAVCPSATGHSVGAGTGPEDSADSAWAWWQLEPEDPADREPYPLDSSDLPDPLDGDPYRASVEPWCDDITSTVRTRAETDGADGEPADAAARRTVNATLANLNGIAPNGRASGRAGATTVYVHLTDHTLAHGNTVGAGILRVENLGPLLASQLAELVGHRPYLVQPVIDLNQPASVDAYEVPRRIRERIKLVHPVEQFPYGTAPTTESTDLDHLRPYDPLGPPGQTSTTNLIPLRRFTHRLKTHGRWTVRTLPDGTLQWTSPHRFTFHVDHAGTHPAGRTAPVAPGAAADPPCGR